jgi:hypothetical protein
LVLLDTRRLLLLHLCKATASTHRAAYRQAVYSLWERRLTAHRNRMTSFSYSVVTAAL